LILVTARSFLAPKIKNKRVPMFHPSPEAVVITDLLPATPDNLHHFLPKGAIGLKARKWLVLIRPPTSA
jgi:hypothetical protein